jgi:hypothetical protein
VNTQAGLHLTALHLQKLTAVWMSSSSYLEARTVTADRREARAGAAERTACLESCMAATDVQGVLG